MQQTSPPSTPPGWLNSVRFTASSPNLWRPVNPPMTGWKKRSGVTWQQRTVGCPGNWERWKSPIQKTSTSGLLGSCVVQVVSRHFVSELNSCLRQLIAEWICCLATNVAWRQVRRSGDYFETATQCWLTSALWNNTFLLLATFFSPIFINCVFTRSLSKL